jgi:4-hydroxybenzoate polyprenyltransferase
MNSTVGRLLYLVQVSRPILWPVLPLLYAFGLRVANAKWTSIAIAQALVLTFPMSLIGCGLNDIYDYESDRRSGRRRAIWGAVVTPAERPLVFQACGTIPLVILSACLTRNRDNFMATVSLVVMAWIYSVPPYRLKERSPLDSIANGLGYFLLPLMMGYSLRIDPHDMPLKYYLLALCVAGVHALATAADVEPDRAAGHRTFAVLFGPRVAAAFPCAAFALAGYMGDFTSGAVRSYLLFCTAVTLPAVLLPRHAVIVAANAVIYGGFIVAAMCYLSGL